MLRNKLFWKTQRAGVVTERNENAGSLLVPSTDVVCDNPCNYLLMLFLKLITFVINVSTYL